MASIDVEVDIDEYLNEASTEALRTELEHRMKKKNPHVTVGLSWGPMEMADDLRKAFYARDANQFEFLLRTLDRQRKDLLTADKTWPPLKKEVA